MEIIKGDITSVKGIKALGKHIGIKKKAKDLGVIFSEKLANAAAAYTKNKVKGAPLYVTKEHLKDGKAQAVVINSGIANVCTGKKGIKDAELTCRLVSRELGINENDVLVASTGIIGHCLPMDKLKQGIKGIKGELKKKSRIAEAIMTTDKIEKKIAIRIGDVTVGAVAKGSGMLHPNMATMLCFICTDADIESAKLKQMLINAVDKSFNMLSVDRDTSTSDMVVLMANGLAGKVDEREFQKALELICIDITKKMAIDGEGATKLIECRVKNAPSGKDAVKTAKAVVSSNLVKSMFFGEDANWGRIMCAIGYSEANIKEEKIDIFINGIKLVSGGRGLNNSNSNKASLKKIKEMLKKKEILVLVDLNNGREEATAYGCDLTTDYVRINAHYAT